ncbi:hypothetical protein QBC41DRAFT_248926 [Cercophora samala]|uniref:Uncharacterized protein n=1 Tax=Cercophora samala TaxID=330535 RepID=A0AA39ZFB7_9PEZI|nr:hypothetical protein QBC41DRAFT_248926 [Cercophora samala]
MEPKADRRLTPEETYHCLKADGERAHSIPLPECTCCLFFQFYSCGCPDTQSFNATSIFDQPVRLREPIHLPSRYHCPIHYLHESTQKVLLSRGFLHKPDPLPISRIPVELPFPCTAHQEACTYKLTKQDLETLRRRVRPTAAGFKRDRVTKIKRKHRAKREVEWSKRHKKTLRAFVKEHTPLKEVDKPKVLHPEDTVFIEDWDRFVDPPLHVKLEAEDWFLDEQRTDLKRDDTVSGSRAGEVFYPKIGQLGRGKYEVGATVLDECLVRKISQDQWSLRGYPWELVYRNENSDFCVWTMS